MEPQQHQQPGDGERKDNLLRKPLSGKLHITIREARDLGHAPLLKRSSKVYNETSVVVKVEGTARATTFPSRTDKWNQEFEISVDKANEVEIALFDKAAGGKDTGDGSNGTPIGLLWLRLNDVVEALRKQRAGAPDTQAGGEWATAAGVIHNQGPGGPGGAGGSGGGADAVFGDGFGAAARQQDGSNPAGQDGITAWFAVEPAGALALDVNFGMSYTFLEDSFIRTTQLRPNCSLFNFHLSSHHSSQRERPPSSRRCRKTWATRRSPHATSRSP